MRTRLIAVLAVILVALAGLPSATARQAGERVDGPSITGPSVSPAGRLAIAYDFPSTTPRRATLQMRPLGEAAWTDVDTAKLSKYTGPRARGYFQVKKFADDSEFRAYAPKVKTGKATYPAMTSNTITVRLVTLTVKVGDATAGKSLSIDARLQPPVPGATLYVQPLLPTAALGAENMNATASELTDGFASDGRASVAVPTPAGGPAKVFTQIKLPDGNSFGNQVAEIFVEAPKPEMAGAKELVSDISAASFFIGSSPSGEYVVKRVDRGAVIVVQHNQVEEARYDVGNLCSLPAAFGDVLDRQIAPLKAAVDDNARTIAFTMYDRDFYAPYNLFAVDTATGECVFVGRTNVFEPLQMEPRVSASGRFVTAIPSTRVPNGMMRNTVFDMATRTDLSTPLGALGRDNYRYPASFSESASTFVQPFFTDYDNEYGGRSVTSTDLASGQETLLWQRGGNEAAASPDGTLVVGAKYGHFVVADTAAGTLTYLADMVEDQFSGSVIRMSPDGRYAMAQNLRRVVAVDLVSGKVRQLTLPSDYEGMTTLYLNGTTFVSIGNDGTVRWSYYSWDAF